MEITKQQTGDLLELKVAGRLDGYWADHLSGNLETEVRGGNHRIRLNLAGVTFLSSAGIRVLLQFHRQLKGIKGQLSVAEPSDPVRKVLEMSGLQVLLLEAAAPVFETSGPVRALPTQLTREGAAFEIFAKTAGSALNLSVVGDPAPLAAGAYREEHCRALKFPVDTFAVGIGALGTDFADCRNRFGEFLAAAGAAAYMPTDGTNVPDYELTSGALVPELKVLYALSVEGAFSHLVRYEAEHETGVIALSKLAEAWLDISGGDAVGVVMAAETAGLVGAALRQSPAQPPASGSTFDHPQIRERLSFTVDRAFARSLTVTVGVAVKGKGSGELAKFVRPLGRGSTVSGHFHSAAFAYRPLQKGNIDLKSTVLSLFEAQPPQGILHLLGDDREIAGAGESEFVRGACWIGPIRQTATEGSR